ncbi:tripartite motif-containing protein 2/3 [Mytilus galloprovincialis]|uniref:Tripartite motif-containing protein 2/3 n=1 Tax=Mytilus galloprovincialis TaxID=29158 RepID=A0A8B6BJ15_MYTGA|nr:tripartite motif-containing protein 2/3 [Mytilus galloprovincialis]
MAQNLLKCQFCKISSNVKWKCETCDVFFCDPCRINTHVLLKNSHGHDVTDYKDIDTECSDKVNLKIISCSTHPEHSCLVYCRNCDKSLCPSCLITPSDQEELKRIYDLRRESLRELRQQVDKLLPFFEEKAAELKILEFNTLSQYNKINEKISERQSELTQEAEELFWKLDSLWDPKNNSLTQEKERITDIENDLKQRTIEIDTALEASSPSSIFTVFEKVNKELPAQTTATTKLPELIFFESRSSDSNFGTIIQVPELKLVNTFNIALPDISAIVTLNTETSVLYSATTNCFQHFTISNFEIVKSLDYFSKVKTNASKRYFHSPTRVVDMTEYRGNILISDEWLGDEIMHFCHSVSQTKFTSISKLQPCGVHATKDSILVGYCHDRDFVTHSSGIITLNSIGVVIRRFECSASSDRLFTFPAKITTNLNNDICIIDYKNGRVVTLGEWGQPKWTYTGHASVNSNDNSFTPHDIVTTMHGHILIADRDSSTIHVVSKDGQFLIFFRHEEIVHPVSLNIDKMGRLLIGCSSDWEGGNHEDDTGCCQTSKLHVAALV